MTDIRFYHFESTTLDVALPAITMKAWQSGKRVLIQVPDKKECARLNDLLWTFHPNVFLPHGADGDKRAADQPVFITADQDNINDSEILILTGGLESDQVDEYNMVCEMLDGRVDAHIQAARNRWKNYKDAGHDLTYWQQDDQGKWEKKG